MVGPRPAVHARDALAVEPRRAVLPRRSRAQGDHRLLGRHVPQLHAEPVVRRATKRARSTSSTGRSSRSRSGWRRARARTPRHRHPLDRGIVDGRRTTRTPRVDTPVRRRSGCSRRCGPTSRSCTRPSPTAHGNVALHPPLLEGVWGALGARRGAIVTVERIVDDLRPWSHLVRIPAHRVLAVVRVPDGRAPRRAVHRRLPVDGYGEDYDFWVDARAATRRDDYDDWIRDWVLERRDQAAVGRAARRRTRRALRAKADPDSWRADAAAYPADLDAPVNAWERAAVWGARYLADRVVATRRRRGARGRGCRQPLGVARRATRAREGARRAAHRRDRALGYDATPADPFVLNHRNFPTATMLGDAAMVLGALVGGAGTTTIGCLGGAQIDRFGNVNSTRIEPAARSSSGRAAATTSRAPRPRTWWSRRSRRNARPADCSYVTSPGHAVRALVTDLGLLEKRAISDRSWCSPRCRRATAARRPRRRGAAACGWGARGRVRRRRVNAPDTERGRRATSLGSRGWFLRAR